MVLSLGAQVPLVQVCGHSRAVSYVRWLGADRLVSASTDNCLKLWDVAAASRAGAAPAPLTTFTGARPAPAAPGSPALTLGWKCPVRERLPCRAVLRAARCFQASQRHPAACARSSARLKKRPPRAQGT